MLSVVIPIHNALPFLKKTLQSVLNTTDNLSELILVDDASDEETRVFIDTLRIAPGSPIRLIKTRNPEHSWTNASWNIGVKLATQRYIAVLNSDITLSPSWDTHLIELLRDYSVACPQLSPTQKLSPIIEEIDPGMIQGACFMFERDEKDYFFPGLLSATHWYLDRYIAKIANEYLSGVGFSPSAIISHAVSQSAKTTKPEEYDNVIKKDLFAWESFTGEREVVVRREMGWNDLVDPLTQW